MRYSLFVRRNSVLNALVFMSLLACKKEEEKEFTVEIAGDGHIGVTESGPFKVKKDETLSIAVTSTSASNDLSTEVDGNCPAGTWEGGTYTTGPIIEDCTLGFAVVLKITAAAGDHVTATPLGERLTHSTRVIGYTATADEGFFISRSVGGTCPAGYWSGDSYYLNRLNENCSLLFKAGTFVVTASAGAGQYITPNESAAVNANETATFTVNNDAGKNSTVVTGTCPLGTWGEGQDYTTGPIAEDCTVIFKPE